MKVYLFYRPNSEHERLVTVFAHDFARETGKSLDLINVDTIDGSEKAQLYGVMSFPAIVAASDEGIMQQIWQGEMLPTINEVSYYTSRA